jgi:hypothetical protein
MRLLLCLWLWPVAARAERGDAIVARNIFCSGCGERAPPPFELVSTLVSADAPRWSRALLRDRRSGDLWFGAIGGSVGAVRLVEIQSRWVQLLSAGANFRLQLEPAANLASDQIVTRTDVKEMLAHPERLRARAFPTPEGFVLRLRPDSPLLALGLRDNDRIAAVDGTRLDGMDALLAVWPRLSRAERVQLTIIRDGQPISLVVRVN